MIHPHRRLVKLQRRIFSTIRAEVRKTLGPQPRELKNYYAAYKRDFRGPYRSSSKQELLRKCIASDIILIGDYHTFPASQKAALDLFKELHNCDVKVTLALEMVPTHHQEILDRYVSGAIKEEEFLKEIDYESTWGFPWEPFRKLLEFAREINCSVVALNGTSKDLEKRDEHAASVLTSWIEKYPKEKILALYGDLHLARGHIPRLLRKKLKERLLKRKVLTVLQNSESIYWRLTSNKQENAVDVVSLGRERFCIMNAAPWVKLQSYLQWAEANTLIDPEDGPTGTPLTNVHDIAHDRLRDILSALNLEVPQRVDFTIRTFDDLEVLNSDPTFKNLSRSEIKYAKCHILLNRPVFIPQSNLIYLPSFSINTLGEGISMFAHALLSRRTSLLVDPSEDYYSAIVYWAIAYFGSKILNHKRKCDLEDDFRIQASRRLPSDALPQEKIQRKVAALVLQHLNAQREFLRSGFYRPKKKQLTSKTVAVHRVPLYVESTRALGFILGEKLYASYSGGLFSHDRLEMLLRTRLGPPVDGRKLYLELVDLLKDAPLPYSSKDEKF